MKKFLSLTISIIMILSVINLPSLTAYAAGWTVTFHNVDGAGGTLDYQCENNRTIPRSQDPVRDGCYFAGWFKDSELTQQWYDSDKVTASIDLYAKWINLSGAVVTDAIDRNAQITYEGNGLRYGDRILTWFAPGFPYYDADKNLYVNTDVAITVDLGNTHKLYGAALSATNLCGDYKFYGSLDKNEWVELAYVQNGQKFSDCQFTEGAKYRFVKLETLGNHGATWWAFRKVAILGVSSSATYNVTYISEGNIFAEYKDVEENSIIPAPVEIPKHSEGLNFAGWYYDEACSQPVGETDVLMNNINLYAKWIGESCKVTFINDGVETVKSLEKGDTVSVPAEPSKENYLFCGWYADAECTVLYDFTAPVGHDINIYAGWALADNSINRANGFTEIVPMTSYDNRSGRTATWFTNPDSTTDKSVNASVGKPISVKLTLDRPYVITAVKTTLMDSMKNIDYQIKATNTPDIAYDDAGWITILDVKANGETKRNFAVKDTEGYKYLQVFVDTTGWRGFYGIEFFGTPAPVTSAVINSISDTEIAYNINLTNQDAAAKIILALYKDNCLIEAKTIDPSATLYETVNAADSDSAAIFIWENLTTLKPIVMVQKSK